MVRSSMLQGLCGGNGPISIPHGNVHPTGAVLLESKGAIESNLSFHGTAHVWHNVCDGAAACDFGSLPAGKRSRQA